MTLFKWLSLILLLILSEWTKVSLCQAATGDDSAANEATDSQDSAPASDPNLTNAPNNQGYGKNVPTQHIILPKSTPSTKDEKVPIGEQTVQAALQFGVLVMIKYGCFEKYSNVFNRLG